MLGSTAAVEKGFSENKYKHRCSECFHTDLNIRPDSRNLLQASICDQCLKKNINDTEWYRKSKNKMDKFNVIGISLTKSFTDYEKLLRKLEYEDSSFSKIKEFIADTFEANKNPSCRTPVTTDELVSASTFKFSKNLQNDYGTIPNLLGRMSFAFKILSTLQRKNLTYKDEFGYERDVERTKVEVHEGWHGEIVAIGGPYLSTHDLRVLLSLLKIHFDYKNEGLILKTSLRTIASGMKISCGKSNLDSIKGALRRLANCRINVTVLKGTTFTDSFFSGGYDPNNCAVEIKWSEYLMAHYRRNQYAMLNLATIFSLSDHAQLIYAFLITHEEKYKFISLEKWQKILGRDHVVTKYFKRDIKKALDELVEKALISNESKIDAKSIVHTHMIIPVIENNNPLEKNFKPIPMNFNNTKQSSLGW